MTLREQFEENKKMLEGQSMKEKLQWFWHYYWWAVCLVVFFAIFFGSLIVSMVTHIPVKLSVVMLNGRVPMEMSEEVSHELADYAHLENGEKALVLDLSGYITPGGAMSEMEMAMQQKVVTLVVAGSLDVLAADAYNYESYAGTGLFADLRTVLSDEQIERYEPYFYYIDEAERRRRSEDYNPGETVELPTQEEALLSELKAYYVAPDPSTMEEPVPVGIFYSDSPYNKEKGIYIDEVSMIGIVASSENHAEAAAAVDYFWGVR